jgi:hypothetical protein
MRRRGLRFLFVLGLLLVSAVLTPLNAGAQSDVTFTIGADSVLLDPTLVQVPVEITCQPMDVVTFLAGGQLKQALSKHLIATGSGRLEGSTVVCDGLPHPNSYLFWVDFGSPSFTKGDATVFVTAFLCDQISCQSGSSGIEITRINKP